jgi:type IV secretory pathway VirB10-like protein
VHVSTPALIAHGGFVPVVVRLVVCGFGIELGIEVLPPIELIVTFTETLLGETYAGPRDEDAPLDPLFGMTKRIEPVDDEPPPEGEPPFAPEPVGGVAPPPPPHPARARNEATTIARLVMSSVAS